MARAVANRYLRRLPFGNSYVWDMLSGKYVRVWRFPKLDMRPSN